MQGNAQYALGALCLIEFRREIDERLRPTIAQMFRLPHIARRTPDHAAWFGPYPP